MAKINRVSPIVTLLNINHQSLDFSKYFYLHSIKGVSIRCY